MIQFLHLADLHLGASQTYLGALARERSGDFLNAFERAIDYALLPENSIDFIIVAGDFFDSAQPSQEVIRFAIGQIKRLHQLKIPLILAPGNHDALGMPNCVYNDEAIGFRQYVILIDTPKVQPVISLDCHGEKVHFYGMAWDFYQSRPPFDTFQKHSTDGFHIAVVHGTLAGSRYSEAHSREVPLDPRNLANSGMDYIALGHIHYYQKVQAGEIPVVYPGTLECRRFTPGEENDRFLVVVKLEKNQPPVFKQIKWNKKTFLQLTFDLGRLSVGSQDELVEFILQRCRGIDKVVRIELLGESSFLIDTEKLISRLSGDFFWLTIEDKTQVFNNFIIENWVQEDTIRGLCIRKLKQHLQSVQTEDEKNRINLALKLAVHSFQKTK